MRDKGIEVKVGALVLVSVALLVVFVLLLGDFVGGRRESVIYVDYPTASDIKPGAPVKVAGVNAGKVDKVEYWGGKEDPEIGRRVMVRVVLGLDAAKAATLHQDAGFYISTLGLLGEKYVEVDPGSWDKPILALPAKVTGIPPLRLEVVAQNLNKVADSVVRILNDNEKVLGNVLQHADDALVESKGALKDVRVVLGETKMKVFDVLDKAGDLGTDAQQLVKSVQRGVGDGGEIRRTLRHVEGISANASQEVPHALKDMRAISGNLRTLSVRLKDEPTMKVLLGDAGHSKVIGVVGSVDGVMGDVRAVTDNARRGRGTVGGLMMDNELFLDLKLMLKDLKRHPWKMIWRE